MDPRTRTELRILKAYVILSIPALALVSLAAFARAERQPRFEEITVERINVVEKDGTLRLVISNRERAPDAVFKGKTVRRSGGNSAGMIFYNDEGTEDGGLAIHGREEGGRYTAGGALLFDQFNQDQTIGILYSDDSGRRSAALQVWDRPNASLGALVERLQAIERMPEGAPKAQARAELEAAARRGEFGVTRLIAGKTRDKAAVVLLSDPRGRTRLRLAVDSTGAPRLDFLDESGRVTYALPDSARAGRR